MSRETPAQQPLAALVSTVSETVRDVTAELLRRLPEQSDLVSRFQSMVDDVFARWDDLERDAQESRIAAERASSDAQADMADAEARVTDYIDRVERLREEEGAQAERDCEARMAEVLAQADADEAAHHRRLTAVLGERDALATALSAMTAAVSGAAKAEDHDHARLDELLAAAAGRLEPGPVGDGDGQTS